MGQTMAQKPQIYLPEPAHPLERPPAETKAAERGGSPNPVTNASRP